MELIEVNAVDGLTSRRVDQGVEKLIMVIKLIEGNAVDELTS
jgi:hypothetical protein